MKNRHLPPHIFLFALALLLLPACKSADPTPIVPKGDPAEAARNFINAFYNGDSASCQELASNESRSQIRELCKTNIDRASSIDLSEAQFTVIQQPSRLEAIVEMTGRWTISALTENGQLGIESHDAAIEGGVRLWMIYQDGRWRFFTWPE